jgi:hypothetical protein
MEAGTGTGGENMRVTISLRKDGDKYALGEDGKALAFGTVKEAINFLADRNWTIWDLREIDWHFEGEAE